MDEFNYYNGQADARTQQAKDPHAEREALDTAIDNVENQLATYDNAVCGPAIEGVIEAARKHLETLPKPEPKFRVVGVRRLDGLRCTGQDQFSSSSEADHTAALWMKHGAYSSVAVEQVP